ncbi:hypothetical protein RHS04_08778 [Rhizoctonia solani]|uniref:Uncharacterized protein n=1 Tax=Rhizoctonia solani TaxID=456999 RepID=A0A8H7GZ68_9AGAM|nr:hypothetical protein RHS04_08778 [Rhizoctonia solani]
MNSTCPAEPEPDYCSFVLANPDISCESSAECKQVRIAVYVQVGLNLLASIKFESNVRLTRDAARTMYVLSISLVGASIVQWKIGGLGLFDALVGTQLATLMTVFMLFNIRYISSLGLSANVSSTLFLMLYTYWGIQTWSFPPCPSNSLTVFVLFGRSMPATQPGLRTFALMVFGMIGVVALGSLILLVDWIRKVWSRGGEVVARKMELWMNSKRQKYGIGKGKLSRLSLLSFPIIIYLLVTTEQLVARNQSAHNLTNLDEWTFGQTIAVEEMDEADGVESESEVGW